MPFAEIALYIVKDCAAVISLLLIIKTFFSEKYIGSPVRFSLSAAAVLLYTLLCYRFVMPLNAYGYEVLDACSNLFYLVSVFVFFRKPAVFRSIAFVFLYCFTAEVLWSFTADLFGRKMIAELLFYVVLFSAVLILIRVCSFTSEANVLSGAFREIPKWILFALLVFELTCYYKEFGISAKWYDVLYAFSACMIFVCILYLIYRIFRLVYTQNMILQRLNEQLTYSEKLSASDERLRSFRHDFKNHMIVINSLFENGDIQGAKAYFAGLTESADGMLKKFSTGNPVVDSLLDVKSAKSAQYGAEIVFSGMIPPDGIAQNDMCIAVGNLIDNAVEACAAPGDGEKKTISVTGTVKNNALLLTVSNPAAAAGSFRARLLRTTKKDTGSHGFGMKNVNAVAEKYSGSFSVRAENGLFTAELFLQLTHSGIKQ